MVAPALAAFRGHRMAKAALETAVLDAELKARGVPLSRELGAVRERVPCGVSVGIMDSIPALLDAVGGYLDAGYVRIKLKIEPGWDVEPVRAVRERFGDELLLQVDANTAYTLADARHLARLDPFGLLLIEQPLDEEDIRGHAELATIVSHADLPGRVDRLRARRRRRDRDRRVLHRQHQARPGRGATSRPAGSTTSACAHGVPVWCGGMLETGLGRAANLALAALPGFTLPGDTSASDRYYAEDVTEPFVLEDGHLPVPTGPGIGVEPIPEILDALTLHTEWIPLDA